MRAPDMEKQFTTPDTSFGLPGRVAGEKYKWRAWKTNFERTGATRATLSQYLVHCPHLHAFWSYWWISLIHLRDMEGVGPAVRDFENAEHEISVYAQDPQLEPDPDVMDTARFLLPVDVNEQIQGLSDGEAVDVLKMLVERVIEGRLAPDSDFRRLWRPAIEDAVLELAKVHA